MDIRTVAEADSVRIDVRGRLDTNTAMMLETAINDSVIGDVDELILDLCGLRYISSAGLRVLLVSQKKMDRLNGRMLLKGVNPEVEYVLRMTGFTDFLTIEENTDGTEG